MFKSVTALKLLGYRTGQGRHTHTDGHTYRLTQPIIVKDGKKINFLCICTCRSEITIHEYKVGISKNPRLRVRFR